MSISMNAQIEKTLTHIEQIYIGDKNPYWNITRDVGMFLHMMVSISQAKKVLEVGTSIGYSALFFADALQTVGGTLQTVESHNERFAIATKHFEMAGVGDTVQQIKGHAPEVLVDVKVDIDIAFFDATKYEHVSYVKAIESKLSDTAIVIADNCSSHEKDMNAYIEYMNAHENFESVLIPLGTGLLMSVKK